jgi:hypothetical protein
MKCEHVDPIARAVLYEGYLLYPYRASALKNRQRFNFGAVYPRSYSEAGNGTDAWAMQTECLVHGGPATKLQIMVRFLHLRERISAARSETPSWQEAVEREVLSGELDLVALSQRSQHHAFGWAAERIHETQGEGAETETRDQRTIAGTVLLASTPFENGLYRLQVRIENITPLAIAEESSRAEALLHTLVSAHTILVVGDGAFVSLFDPPAQWRTHVAQCANIGTWPVLVGREGATDMMLSAPIILYDYPRVAPESPGDFCDATEIDEMLSLRVLTLTDGEKQEMRAADPCARALLQRTEALTGEQLWRLHGTMHSSRSDPICEEP